MRQKSNSILDSLKKLYIKMTGKKIIKRKTECDVLSDIAEEYVPAEDIVKEYMSKVYEYKGSVASYSALPTEDVDTGDVYNVLDTGKNYAWTGTEWDNLGGASLIFTTDITQLTTPQLNELKAGDIVIKQTGTQNHTYIVTYQEYLHGICLSYFASGYTETVSYDYIDNAWVYNSTDINKYDVDINMNNHNINDVAKLKFHDNSEQTTACNVVANPTLAGTEGNLEGIEINGIKYKAGGASDKHLHIIKFQLGEIRLTVYFKNNKDSDYTVEELRTALLNEEIVLSNVISGEYYSTTNGSMRMPAFISSFNKQQYPDRIVIYAYYFYNVDTTNNTLTPTQLQAGTNNSTLTITSQITY